MMENSTLLLLVQTCILPNKDERTELRIFNEERKFKASILVFTANAQWLGAPPPELCVLWASPHSYKRVIGQAAPACHKHCPADGKMSRCISNNTASQCPMSNYSEMYGDASYNYHNSRWNCEGTPQYPYTQQDHEGLRYLGVKNYAVAHTLDGQPVYKPVDERAYSCDCNLENPDNFQFMRNPYNYEARKGRFSRGCDCHNRNGMQDQCARQDHQDRWRCYGPQNPRSEVPRLQYEAHQHHRPGTPQHPQCSCGH